MTGNLSNNAYKFCPSPYNSCFTANWLLSCFQYASDRNCNYLDNSKEAEEMMKEFSEWVKQGRNCQVRAEMLRVAKVRVGYPIMHVHLPTSIQVCVRIHVVSLPLLTSGCGSDAGFGQTLGH